MSEQKILAFAGKKRAGKNTCANFIVGLEMVQIGMISQFRLNEQGKLVVPSVSNEEVSEGVFDLDRRDPAFMMYLDENVSGFVKIYSFAGPLKDFCINVLGLTHEQCYGTTEQKNTLTRYKWETFPLYSNEDYKLNDIGYKDTIIKTGPMTAREVMQYFGTEIGRKMYTNLWTEACLRRVKLEDSYCALMCDCRFPEEVEATQKAGGKVVYLTRKVEDKDEHESETALDPDKFDHSKFDAVIDNANMTIPEQNEAVHNLLVKWGWKEAIT